MSNYFQESFLSKVQTDPVMNAVMNSKQKMLHTRGYFVTDITNPALPRAVNAAAGPFVYQSSARMPSEVMRNSDYDPNAPRLGRVRWQDVIKYTRHNPNLYWQNIMPEELYNLNRVNTPNPTIDALRTLPIHISSVHQTFSS